MLFGRLSCHVSQDGDLLDSGRLQLKQGDGWRGCPEEAPFDCIHVGAAAETLPEATIQQLKVGGSMIIPVGGINRIQELLLIRREHGGGDINHDFKVTRLMSVAYVPLVRS